MNKINYSLWFAQGSFHTNTIEGLKRNINDFWAINGSILTKLAEKGITIDDYANGIICYGLFLWNINIKNKA